MFGFTHQGVGTVVTTSEFTPHVISTLDLDLYRYTVLVVVSCVRGLPCSTKWGWVFHIIKKKLCFDFLNSFFSQYFFVSFVLKFYLSDMVLANKTKPSMQSFVNCIAGESFLF